jgi:hypothetical protein
MTNDKRKMENGVSVHFCFFEGLGVGVGFTIGPPAASQALRPPSNALASLNPFCCSRSAARALEFSDGQAQ